MTNADDPIVQTIFRQTGKESYRPATENEIKEGVFLVHKEGLTKREMFAAMAKIDTDGYSVAVVELVTGKPQPTDPVLRIFWFNEFEALLKVNAADAIIAALNKS